MDLKKEYDALYQHWLKEFSTVNLTLLTVDVFTNYKKNSDFLVNYKPEPGEPVKTELFNAYRENYRFLFNDLLNMREIKILNAALALKEIDLTSVIEAEKMFYQNLIATVKGFKKVQMISIPEDIISKTPPQDTDLEAINTLEKKKIDEDKEQHVVVEEQIPSEFKNTAHEVFNYILIRFLKKCPSLVGVDLLNYGPFEKESVASMPFKNANILIAEKTAEKIDIQGKL